jgi:hypothetical protein
VIKAKYKYLKIIDMKKVQNFLNRLFTSVKLDNETEVKVIGQPDLETSVVVSAEWVLKAYNSLSTGSIHDLKRESKSQLMNCQNITEYEQFFIDGYMWVMTNKEIREGLGFDLEKEPREDLMA